MCLPAEWNTLTREERLMEQAAIRKHHIDLGEAIHKGYVADGRRHGANYEAAMAAYDAHTEEHKAAGRRLRAERVK